MKLENIPETSISGETDGKGKVSLADTVVGFGMSFLSSQLSFIDINRIEEPAPKIVVALTQNLADTQDMENFVIDTEIDDYLKNHAWAAKVKPKQQIETKIPEEQEVEPITPEDSVNKNNERNDFNNDATSESSLPLTISSSSEMEKANDSFDSDVIVIDSDLSNNSMEHFSHLLPLRGNDSFENCSSIAISELKQTVSEDLNDEFFENVPDIISLENVVTHSAILKHREATSQKSNEMENVDRFVNL